MNCKECADLETKAYCEHHKTMETYSECAEKQEME